MFEFLYNPAADYQSPLKAFKENLLANYCSPGKDSRQLRNFATFSNQPDSENGQHAMRLLLLVVIILLSLRGADRDEEGEEQTV